MIPSLEFVCPVVSEKLSLKKRSSTKSLVASPKIRNIKNGYVLGMMSLISSKRAINCVLRLVFFKKFKKTTDSDTALTYQVFSVQLVTNKKLEAFNKA